MIVLNQLCTMAASYVDVLRNQGRGMIGALLVVGLTFFYTMEAWWLAWVLPLQHLIVYTVAGLGIVLLISRNIGFREEDERRSKIPLPNLVVEYSEILFQSFVAAFLGLFMLGLIQWGDPTIAIVRLGLLEVVPLGFGAALSNRLFAETDQSASEQVDFPRNVAIFSLGAVFVAATIAPTQEIDLLSAHTTWLREVLTVLVSIGVVYVVLYELGFRGQSGRVYDSRVWELGTTFMVYGISVVMSALLLWSYGHFIHATLPVAVQETIVLSFPAATTAAGAQVVI